MIWSALGFAVVFMALFLLRPQPMARPLKETLSSDDPKPMVTALSELPEAARPTAFDQAVRAMWEGYRRSLAVRTVRDAAGWVAGATITQYWIRQALEIEPELAKEHFDDGFLEAFYQPEVAASCGKFG